MVTTQRLTTDGVDHVRNQFKLETVEEKDSQHIHEHHHHHHHDHDHDHHHGDTEKSDETEVKQVDKKGGEGEVEEEEEMFVDPHDSFGHDMREWGGPRRGGRFPEPTRYGDWERKGRCSDF